MASKTRDKSMYAKEERVWKMSLLSFFNAPPFIDISSFPTFLEVHSLEISYEFKDIWLL